MIVDSDETINLYRFRIQLYANGGPSQPQNPHPHQQRTVTRMNAQPARWTADTRPNMPFGT
jgi:hypothetical protein